MKMHALLFLIFLGVGAPPDSANKAILRFEPGVALTGEGNSREHVYYTSDANEKISAGVWEAGPATYGPRRRAYSEFIHILEGSLTLVDGQGREQTFEAGDSALIPRGTELTWKQTERVRKYWVIFDWETPEEAKLTDPSPKTVIRLEPNGPMENGLTSDQNGRTKSHSYYSAKDERVSVGVWETKPYASSELRTTKYAELMVFLEGRVTLTDGSGQEHRFEAGDVALVPRGARMKWDGEHVKKYWVIFDPATE